jgi:MoaA/NifB/PqqE/SkfB family radical SAM enzyme
MLNPSLDLGIVCDLNCLYCFTHGASNGTPLHRNTTLSERTTLSLLDDFATSGAQTVNIVGGGEPLLYPRLSAVLEYLCDRQIAVVLFTNGIKLAAEPELLRFLFDADVTVVLKYNSRYHQLQDALVGRRGYTDIRNKALDLLIQMGFNESEPTRLGVDTLVFAGNLEEIPDIHRWCRSNNVYPLTADFIPTGRTSSGGLVQTRETIKFDPRLREIAEQALKRITTEQRTELLRALEDIDKDLGIKLGSTRAYYGGGACTQ